MIENFLQNNWRKILLVGIFLFAWFLWPTPYTPLVIAPRTDGWNSFIKQSRITGKVYTYGFKDGVWTEDVSSNLKSK